MICVFWVFLFSVFLSFFSIIWGFNTYSFFYCRTRDLWITKTIWFSYIDEDTTIHFLYHCQQRQAMRILSHTRRKTKKENEGDLFSFCQDNKYKTSTETQIRAHTHTHIFRSDTKRYKQQFEEIKSISLYASYNCNKSEVFVWFTFTFFHIFVERKKGKKKRAISKWIWSGCLIMSQWARIQMKWENEGHKHTKHSQ